MTPTIEPRSSTTVTPWDNPFHAKKKREITAIALKALAGTLISPFHLESWDEIVNGTTVHHSMTQSQLLKSSTWMLFNKIMSKKNLSVSIDTLPTDTTVKAPTTENPLDYLLPLLDSASEDTPLKASPLTEDEINHLYISDLYSFEVDKPKDEPKNLSDEDIANAFAYLGESFEKKDPGVVDLKDGHRESFDDLLELFSR